MPHDPRKCLEDIRRAASLILTATRPQTREAYLQDEILRAAVEREFEIIGEALNRLRKIDIALAEQIPEHRRVIAFRNLLAHATTASITRLSGEPSRPSCRTCSVMWKAC